MRYIKSYYAGHAFVDIVDGRDVFYYKDCYGDVWMKNS